MLAAFNNGLMRVRSYDESGKNEARDAVQLSAQLESMSILGDGAPTAPG